ncbi:MAG TPA: LicD family protein [Gaiellaceae bacterium]|nr:LicD family protein [Gaiellaceae bacterium]
MHLERVESALRATHALLEEAGIWHCVTYGTLLGAVRDGALIPWDHDFDFFIRAGDLSRVLALDGSRDGLRFLRTTKSSAELALGGGRVGTFDAMRIAVFDGETHLGDLFAPTLFDDGVLRIYDLATEVNWTPHSSFPHFFVETLSTVRIGSDEYPGVGHAEQFLAGVYGDDWQTPYRSVMDGGELRTGSTTHGDTYEPKLADEIAWCEARGWDRSRYAGLPAWPREVAGAGPIGPTERTSSSSGALWYRDRAELLAHY